MDNADKGPQDVGNDYPSMKESADSERAANEAEFERVFNQVADKPMADASDYSNEGRNPAAPEPDSNYSHEGRNATSPIAPAVPAAPMTFGQKFAAERKAGNKTFKWGDKIITTQLLSEVPAKAKPKAAPAQTAPVKSVMLQAAPPEVAQQADPAPFDPYRGRVAIAGEAAPTARAVVKAAPAPVKAVAVAKNPALDIANPVSRPLPQDNFPISPAILDRRTPTALEASNRRIEKVGTTTLSDLIVSNRYGAQKS